MVRISKHCSERAQGRNVQPDEVLFICQHGTQTGKGYVLTKADARQLEAEALEVLRKARKLQGILAAVKEDTITTVFRLNHSQERSMLLA